ncbi:PIN domain-containing protein [Paracraurococcus lichenis]|uniref:Ribonuclease VapC n=1 Tax=Paracraurococcus lichenis TaxID=3064888 RepID=A0ABT9DUU0_9PROT|nr:PIN domain-containing protein [Paracraurococcus sp. LOR1-02]MDO9707662.1 PIN domain-containing protein [Paracraurococcus sp. LOR1-02]
MSDAFLDTNILLYAALQPDPRSEAARALLAQGGVVSVQVLNEFAAVARRKLRRPWPEIRQALDAIRILCPAPRPLTDATHDAALGLAERHGFPFYDALIVAAALEAGCTVLVSEDFQHGQVVEGRLAIRNPFAVP